MTRLIIVGAGSFSREIFSWLRDSKEYTTEWERIGFLDTNPEILKKYSYDFPILGSVENYQPREDDLFVMGFASPTWRKIEIAEQLSKRGAEFISLIHSTVIMGNNVSIGRGCVVCQYVVLTCDIKIGEFVTINISAAIGHDVIIDEGCTIYSFGNINGYGRLGKCVEIGSHAGILPKVKVGDFAKIGAGSMAYKHVKPNTTVVGVPAKKLY